MTLNRPMFPPGVDRKKCSHSERFSTCSEPAPVENGSENEPFPVNGAGLEPLTSSVAADHRCALAAGTVAGGPPESGLYYRIDMTPEEIFRALGRLRSEAEAAVERLIALIDALDADPDAEPTGDELEPSLGAPENHPTRTLFFRAGKIFRDFDGVQVEWASGNDDEREGGACHDDREGDELEHGGDEHDGREPDVDDEPLLGSFDRFWNQEHAWRQTSGAIGRCWDIHSNCDAERDSAL